MATVTTELNNVVLACSLKVRIAAFTMHKSRRQFFQVFAANPRLSIRGGLATGTNLSHS
jgi:hypothetical protein